MQQYQDPENLKVPFKKRSPQEKKQCPLNQFDFRLQRSYQIFIARENMEMIGELD